MNGAARCVIFDVDGTLLDSSEAQALAWLEALREAGYLGLRPQTLRRLVGLGPDQLLALAVGLRHDSPAGREVQQRRDRLFRRHYLPGLRPYPQVRELLERVVADGGTPAVVLPEAAEEVAELLAVAGVADLVHLRVTGADCARSKPCPDGVRLAMELAGSSRWSTLLVGDTPYDVELGWNAGVGVVALRSGGWGELDLGGALAVYGGPAHLLAEYGTSPLGRLAAAGAGSPPVPAHAFVRRPARRAEQPAEWPQPA